MYIALRCYYLQEIFLLLGGVALNHERNWEEEAGGEKVGRVGWRVGRKQGSHMHAVVNSLEM